MHEGFGFPPLEAMACGVPVIASRRGSLAETLGDAAFAVDPESPRQIADAISQIIDNNELREKYIQRGYRQSRQFSWKKTAGDLLEVYKEVAGAHG